MLLGSELGPLQEQPELSTKPSPQLLKISFEIVILFPLDGCPEVGPKLTRMVLHLHCSVLRAAVLFP